MNRVASTRTCAWLARLLWRPPLRLLIILTINVFGTIYSAKTAPVTFRFDATIESVPPTIPFDSGITFAIGDVVSGQFTFDPALGDGNMVFDSHQPHAFALSINGAEFVASSFEVEAVNDSPTADFPAANLVDILVLGAGGLQPGDASGFPNLDSNHSDFRMTLYGPDNSVPQAGLPSAVEEWNDFDLWRSIEVSFGDGNGHSVGFQALVAPFSAVPEPTTPGMVWLTIGGVFMTSRILPRRISIRTDRYVISKP